MAVITDQVVIAHNGNVRLYLWTGEAAKLADKLGRVKEIGSISLGEAETVEVTNLDSDGKEYAIGATDYGSIEVTQSFTGAEVTKLIALKANAGGVKFGIVIDKAGQEKCFGMTGNGLIKTGSLEGLTSSSEVTVKMSILITGKPTFDFTDPIE